LVVAVSGMRSVPEVILQKELELAKVLKRTVAH
jgi:hypothetical protein